MDSENKNSGEVRDVMSETLPSILKEDEERQNLPSTMTEEQQKEMREHLDRSNNEMLFYNIKNKKVQYTKNMVTLYSPAWWDEIANLMKGNDKDLKKMAMQEFNKLQMRLTPVEVGGVDGEPINVKIVDYNLRQPIEGKVVEVVEEQDGNNRS